jgi:hypothetical protein
MNREIADLAQAQKHLRIMVGRSKYYQAAAYTHPDQVGHA